MTGHGGSREGSSGEGVSGGRGSADGLSGGGVSGGRGSADGLSGGGVSGGRVSGDLWPSRLLRQVVRHVPTPVTVVCTTDGGRPVGATIGSFVNVSLDPPLVAWFAMRPSTTLDAVRRAGSFTVNVLGEDQADLAAAFARPSADRFRGVPWRPGAGGSPHLDGAVVVLDCDLGDVLTLGDHEMVVGQVRSATLERRDVDPLVFTAGLFHGLSPSLVDVREARRPA